jgi:phosphotransferase system HPr (HPr) family protein
MLVDLVVTAPSGLHARPAANFVKTVQHFHARVTLRWNGESANAASILDVLRLGVPSGSHVEVDIEGQDADSLAAALKALEARGFEDTAVAADQTKEHAHEQ